MLDKLKTVTTIVIDTGDFNLIKKYKPTDATTNPTLLYAACTMKEYESIVSHIICLLNSKQVDKCITNTLLSYKITKKDAQTKKFKQSLPEIISEICDNLAVTFGSKIVNIVPGYVSTEVDARLSFDTQKTIAKAKKLIAMYKKLKIDKKRILIKIASTWEGIQAAKVLQRQGIQCNMTLLFNYHQALACAQAGATLISPFVGRILDWYK